MLTGRGEQEWMKKEVQDDRNKALENRDDYTDDELERLEITSIEQGGGETNNDYFEFKQYPYPQDRTYRKREDVDIRDDERVGD